MARHLLVTNDFPPKVGGIQAYLWELWSRLDPRSYAVLTATSAPRRECEAFDADQATRGVRIERVKAETLIFPTPAVLRRIRESVVDLDASLVVFDPAFPLGLLGPRLAVPYALVLHGAEVTVPARLPISRAALSHTVRRSSLVISAGGYPAAEVRRVTRGRISGSPRVVEIPPGVDCKRFSPLNGAATVAARTSFGLREDGPLVVSVSRLVPRKGMDVLIEAVNRLKPSIPGLQLAIGGKGRDDARLRRLAGGGSVRILGAVSDADLPRLLGAADVFVMACRNRWLGLEQEGFGIVFLEAAAAGVAQIAGDSGGAAEAVEDGVTGLVVSSPDDPAELALAIRRLLSDDGLRTAMAVASRRRALASFDYDRLAPKLGVALEEATGWSS